MHRLINLEKESLNVKRYLKDFSDKVNGKKRYIVGGTGAVTISAGTLIFLIKFLIGLNNTAIGAEALANENKLDISKFDTIPAQVEGVERDVKNIDRQFEEFRNNYNDDQRIMRNDIKDILKAVQR